MIAIVNIGPFDQENPAGERNYELRINREVIATFQHRRADGLAACLQHAAEAARVAANNNILRGYIALQKPNANSSKPSRSPRKH